MTVGQLLNTISSRELTEWQAFGWVDSGEYQKSIQKPLDKFRAMFKGRIKK